MADRMTEYLAAVTDERRRCLLEAAATAVDTASLAAAFEAYAEAARALTHAATDAERVALAAVEMRLWLRLLRAKEVER